MLHEEARRLIKIAAASGAPRLADVPLQTAREMAAASVGAMDLPSAEVARADDILVPADHGGIRARLYVPAAQRTDAVFLFFHGGGWVVGNIESHDPLARTIANALGMRLLSVDYRLAPEHRFPTAFDDAMAVAVRASSSPPPLGAPVSALVLGGDSAGGNLAAALSAHWSGSVPLLAQLLLYPVTDASACSESYELFGEGHLLEGRDMAFFIDHYAGAGADRTDPRLSPLHGPVDDAPPTVIVTAGADVLRDEGRAYAARLVQAGVEVHYLEATGFLHGWATARQMLPSVRSLLDGALASVVAIINRR